MPSNSWATCTKQVDNQTDSKSEKKSRMGLIRIYEVWKLSSSGKLPHFFIKRIAFDSLNYLWASRYSKSGKRESWDWNKPSYFFLWVYVNEFFFWPSF